MLLDLWFFFTGPVVQQGQPQPRILERVRFTQRRADPILAIGGAFLVRTTFRRTTPILLTAAGLGVMMRAALRLIPPTRLSLSPALELGGTIDGITGFTSRDDRPEVQRARRLERQLIDMGEL